MVQDNCNQHAFEGKSDAERFVERIRAFLKKSQEMFYIIFSLAPGINSYTTLLFHLRSHTVCSNTACSISVT